MSTATEEKAVIRYGDPGEWKYLVLVDDGGPVFSERQGAAQRFGSLDQAREQIREIAADCEDPDVVRTIVPVRLVGKKRIKR